MSALVTALLLAAVIVLAGARDATTPPEHPPESVDGALTLLNGIPERANVLGYPNAPLRLVYFGDLQCPYCRQFTLYVLPTIISKWVRTGTLRIEYLSMETATRNRTIFEKQQAAALAAGKQDRMWYFLDLFYREQEEENSGYVTEQFLEGIARQVRGLNLARWARDRASRSVVAQVNASKHLANRLGLPGTPSLFLGREGGAISRYQPTSLTDPTTLDQAVGNLSLR